MAVAVNAPDEEVLELLIESLKTTGVGAPRARDLSTSVEGQRETSANGMGF